MKDKKTKQHYSAPEVTVVSFVAERGFNGSPEPPQEDLSYRQDYGYSNENDQIWGVQ